MRLKSNEFTATRGSMTAPELLQWAAGAFIFSTILFLSDDAIDINAAAVFFQHGEFAGRQPVVEMLRDVLKLFYISGVICGIAGLYFGHVRKSAFLGLSTARWMVVLATLIVGPGLVANLLLKDQMGRARPHQTELFGGTEPFSPPLVATDHCQRNCSFVSGEASSMFALLFGLAMVAGTRARSFLALGMVLGTLAGLIRMSQGAHFLSDVVFAGIFMAVTAALMRILIIDLPRLDRANRSAAGVGVDRH